MTRKSNEERKFVCPVGKFFAEIERVREKDAKFFGHITNARVEFLKAVRTLVDERIADLEKRASSRSKRKATKISVE